MAILRPAPVTARSVSPLATALVMLAGGVIGAPGCGSSSSGSNVDVAALCPLDSRRVSTSPSIGAEQFCQLYLQTCKGANNPPGGYTALIDCETAYSGLNFETTRECRSYHVCNAASYDTPEVAVHCRHSIGLDLCPDTATGQ